LREGMSQPARAERRIAARPMTKALPSEGYGCGSLPASAFVPAPGVRGANSPHDEATAPAVTSQDHRLSSSATDERTGP
jgi:hypothetical protein